MKQLRIKTLTLSDFKGQTRSVTFESKDVSIKGKNEEGKSSLQKAWLWLNSGYTDANYGANHELFNNKLPIDENTPIASVEALIELDGIEYKIKRTAKAKFTKAKGSSVAEKAKSDEYKIYVDDVEYTATMFKSWIGNNICDSDKLIYCLDGYFFLNLSLDDKDKAIKIIHDIVGDIKREDFEGDFDTLFKMFERYGLDDLKEQTKSRKKPIIDRLKLLPNLIDSTQKTIEELSKTDNKKLTSDLHSKKKEYDHLEEQLLGISNEVAPLIAKRNKELQSIDDAERELRNKTLSLNTAPDSKTNEILAKISNIDRENALIDSENNQTKDEYKRNKARLETLKKDLESLNKEIVILRNKRNELKSKVFSPEKCSYCDQELPIELQSELIKKFNTERDKELSVVVERGLSTKSKIEEANKTITELESLVSSEPILKQHNSKEDLEKQLLELKNSKVTYESTEEYKAEKERIEKLRSSVTEVKAMDVSKVTEHKNNLLKEIEELNRLLGESSRFNDVAIELDRLKKEQQEQAVALARIEQLELQIKEYEREKAIIASKRVNDLLEYCNIETQIMQKDGSYKDSCTVTRKDGVKYATANGGSRIRMAFDIQRMFCKHLNIAAPLWIDECSVLDGDKIPKYDDTQVICIFRDDCEFKVENL